MPDVFWLRHTGRSIDSRKSDSGVSRKIPPADGISDIGNDGWFFLCDCYGTDNTGGAAGGSWHRKFSYPCLYCRCGVDIGYADDKRKKVNIINAQGIVFIVIMLMIFQIPAIMGESEEEAKDEIEKEEAH